MKKIDNVQRGLQKLSKINGENQHPELFYSSCSLPVSTRSRKGRRILASQARKKARQEMRK